MNILLAGFESDRVGGPTPWNSLAQVIRGSDFGERSVTCISLPRNWDECFAGIEPLLANPWDAILLVGHRGVGSIAIERLALNEVDVSVKDDAGRRARNKVIDTSGQDGYWTTIPGRDLSMQLSEATFPAVLSHCAGLGVGNYVFYQVMRALEQRGLATPAGLIQLPRSMANERPQRLRMFVDCLLAGLDPDRVELDRLSVDLTKLRERMDGGMRVS